jgi:glycosyltransferase involved in cell wall biosynthesis
MSDCHLSLCMIVRDEAAMLPGFLSAVAGLWDELVVADTGSRDGSADLILAAGGQVVDFPWCDDFAAARNASLSAATGRWIIYLDADERVDRELASALRRMVHADRTAGAATIVMRNELPEGGRRESRLLRCFRNVPEIRFRHRIHEDVADDVAAWLPRHGLEMRHLPGGVDHLGYVRATAAARDKKARDVRLLHAALADDPGDLYCRFKLLELARFWDDRELFAAEAGPARKALEAATRAQLEGRHWSGDLAALIAQSLAGPPLKALAWLDGQARRVECGPSWHLRRGILLEEAGRGSEAEAAFRSCLAGIASPTNGYAPLPPSRPLLGLCRLAARRGDVAAATALALQAATDAPHDAEALLAAVSFQPPAAALAFATAHALRHPDSTTPLAQSLLTAGRPQDALALLESASPRSADGPGILVLALALGIGRDVDIGTDLEAAGRQLRSWLQALRASGNAALCEAFTESAGTLAGAFPWLESWLEDRLTAGAASLSPSRR